MGARLQEFRFPGSRLVTPEPLCPYYCFWCTAPKHHQPSSKAFWWGCAHPPQFWSETHNFQQVKSPKTRKVWDKTIQLEFYFDLWTRQRLCYQNTRTKSRLKMLQNQSALHGCLPLQCLRFCKHHHSAQTWGMRMRFEMQVTGPQAALLVGWTSQEKGRVSCWRKSAVLSFPGLIKGQINHLMGNVMNKAINLRQQEQYLLLRCCLSQAWWKKKKCICHQVMARKDCSCRLEEEACWRCLSWLTQLLRYESKSRPRWQGPIYHRKIEFTAAGWILFL